ncbi:MAG: hypothetical protein HZA53_11950 [Planctomycetes bacterium]|nr:hypothetical protein [Planctomycetota bacterium]
MLLSTRTFYCWLCAAALFLLAAQARAGIVDVSIQGFGFNGQHLTIALGDTVRWRQFDATTHTVTEGTDLVLNGNEAFHHSFPSASTNPAPFSVTFDAAFLAANPRTGNRYDYFCVPHSSFMHGSVTVDTGPGTPFCFCANPLCPGINADAGAGCANAAVVFNGARMLGTGTASIATDDLVLTIDRLPANGSALLFRSTSADGANPAVFQDGFLCLQTPYVRTRLIPANAAGVAQFGPGLVAPTQPTFRPILAGQTWHFQVWYPEAPGLGNCGTGSNVSNGYSVAFAP